MASQALALLPKAGGVPLPVVRVLLWVYAFLAFSSAVCYLHPRLRRPEARSVRLAVTSWWPSTLLVGLAVCFGLPVAWLLFAALSVAMLREFLRMLPPGEQDPGLAQLAYAAIPLHYGALLLGGDRLFFGPILLYAFAALPLLAAAWRGPAAVWGVSRLQLGLMLTVLAPSHVVRLFTLPARPPAGGAGLASLLLLCIMMGDAFQYFFGKLLGRHALAPVLSPRKTWEGLLGGTLIVVALAAVAAPGLVGVSRWTGAAVGAALAPCGLLGDLLVSALKRGAGVKDSGKVLPGQGGVLDRCDSLMLAAPLYYYAAAALLY